MILQRNSANPLVRDVLARPSATDPTTLATAIEQCCADILKELSGAIKIVATEHPGAAHGHRFYPDISGWASSHNPYAWSEYIDPAAGVMRLVFGAASRLNAGNEYPRIVALNAPDRRPEAYFEDICSHSQRRADFINTNSGAIETDYVADLIQAHSSRVIELLTSTGDVYHPVTGEPIRALTCEGLLHDTPLVHFMRELLHRLAGAADNSVELTFVLQLNDGLGAMDLTPITLRATEHPIPFDPATGKVLFSSQGYTLGRSRFTRGDRLVHNSPRPYSLLSLTNRFALARLMGRIRRTLGDAPWILAGPGRWGTSSPELGVPVRFAEISSVGTLVEIAEMHEALTPEVSLGTHFMNDIISHDILCAAVLPERKDHFVDSAFFEQAPNSLARFMPGAEVWKDVLHLLEARDCGGESFIVWADAVQRRMICAIEMENNSR
jgi:hypothetical protein